MRRLLLQNRSLKGPVLRKMGKSFSFYLSIHQLSLSLSFLVPTPLPVAKLSALHCIVRDSQVAMTHGLSLKLLGTSTIFICPPHLFTYRLVSEVWW